MPTMTPTSPAAPAAFEWRKIALVASNVNPFNAKEQVYAWSANPYFEASVSMPPMDSATAQAWSSFITGLNGPVNTLIFPVNVCNLFPFELTYDQVFNSTNPRIFRLKGNQVTWSVKEGRIYTLTFEIREAL